MKRHTAEILLVLVTALWGGTFVLVKGAMGSVDPSTFVALRFSVAAVLSMLIWPSALRVIDATTAKRGVVLGALYGAGFLLQTIGLTSTSASTSAFITGTMVGFVPIVQFMLFRTGVKRTHVVSIVTILTGLYLFTAPELHGVQTGDVLTLVSAFVWALYMVLIDRWSTALREEPTKQNSLVILQFVVTCILALGGSAIHASPSDVDLVVRWNQPLIIAIIYCSVFASIIPTFVQTRYQQYTHPVRAGVIYALEPLFASIIAFLLVQESFTPRQLLGGGVLIAAVVVPDLWQSWRKK
jgi:drug/metabolite transporter (DMT)-like permease